MSATGVTAHVRAPRWLAEFDPRIKLAWLATISLIAVLVDTLPALATLAFCSALPVLALRLSRSAWLAILTVMAITVWSTMLSQALFYPLEPRTKVLSLGTFALYREGAIYGLIQSLRFVASVLAGLTVVFSTSPERLLSALVSIGVPSSLAFVTVSALRSVPALVDAFVAVRRARRWRQLEDTPSWRERLLAPLTNLRLLVPVAALALRRSTILATSVSARGFRPGRERTFFPPLYLRWSEFAVGLALALLATSVALLKSAQWWSQAGVWSPPELARIVEWTTRNL